MEPDLNLPSAWIMAQLLAGGIAILLPILLVVLAQRRIHGRWRVVAWGAAVFAASQLLVRLPLVAFFQGQLQSTLVASTTAKWLWILALSFSAGLFEEVGRWLGYRYLIPKEPRTGQTAVLFGLGHGGVESILLVGVGMVISALVVPTLPSIMGELPEEARAQALAQLQAIQDMPWWAPLLGAWERASSLAVHVSLSVLVLQAFVRRGGALWVLAAIVFHGLANLAPVAILEIWGRTDPTVLVLAEVVITGFAVVGIALAVSLRTADATRWRR